MPEFPPTSEQKVIIEAASDPEHPDLEVQAGAGAGKTSTLRYIANAMPQRQGLAITYNKDAARDLAKVMPRNFKASTAHSLAWQAIIKPNNYLRDRLDDEQRLPAKEVGRRLGLQTIDLGDKKISPWQMARLVQDAVANFCRSAEDRPMAEHMPLLEGIDEGQQDEFDEQMLRYARKAWIDLSSNTGKLFFSHDHYLKLYQLSHPFIRAQILAVDEAQDLNGVMESIVAQQGDTQKIIVGDSNQAINGWNGAIDAMDHFGGKRLLLTQSFRFGDTIAAEANKWLSLLQSELRLRGTESITSVVGKRDEPSNAILTRTNAAAMAEAIKAIQAGLKPAVVGGTEDLRRLALAAGDLKAGEKSTHPALFLFENWAELREHVDEDRDGSDLKVFANLIDTYGVGTVLFACNHCVNEESADVVISTAHKSKGREWASVRIGSDFDLKVDRDGNSLPPDKADLMLAYVSVTRAKTHLDVGSLAWVDTARETRGATLTAMGLAPVFGKDN